MVINKQFFNMACQPRGTVIGEKKEARDAHVLFVACLLPQLGQAILFVLKPVTNRFKPRTKASLQPGCGERLSQFRSQHKKRDNAFLMRADWNRLRFEPLPDALG